MKVTLNVTVDRDLVNDLERYRAAHQLKTRSDAIEKAIRSLRRSELGRDARFELRAILNSRLVGVHEP